MVVTAASIDRCTLTNGPKAGFVRLRQCLTVFLVEITMPLVEDNAVFAARQLDMGRPG